MRHVIQVANALTNWDWSPVGTRASLFEATEAAEGFFADYRDNGPAAGVRVLSGPYLNERVTYYQTTGLRSASE